MKYGIRNIAMAVGLLGILIVGTAAIAGLLGVVPSFPLMSFEGGATTAQISNGLFEVKATPARMLISPTGPLTMIVGPSSLEIKVAVNPSDCELVGGVAGDDLIITGTVNMDPLGAGDVRSGTLLTGEVLALGIGTPSGSTDPFDFRFQVTGGSLADFYTNEDAGVTLNIENFLFAGDCEFTSLPFQGKPKGNVGPIPPIMAAEGCTPGYWKQKHHFDSWEATGFDPDQTVESVFGLLDPSVDDVLLKDALKLKGGGLNALIRHAVAALLNSASPDVNSTAFGASAEVIAAAQAAVNGGDIEATKNAFEEANEEGCPLN